MGLLATVLFINLTLALARVIYILKTPLDLSPEEAQYWDWSRHLDLSYYSKPPMVAYLNFITTHLLGNTELAVRITPVLLSFLLSVITFFFVKRLFDNKTAFLAAVLPNMFVGYSINSLLMTTDAPFIFFWALSVIFVYFASQRDSLRLWLAVGLFSGLAFLSKYPAVFLLPLALAYMAIYERKRLMSPKPYVSIPIAFLLSLPVLVWNVQRDFVSFKHVSTLGTKSGGFKAEHILNYIGGQVLLLSGVFFLLLVWAWYLSLRSKDRKLVFLTLFSLPVFAFFLILSVRKEVYANWAGFGYFTGGILVAYVFRKFLDRFPRLALSSLFLPLTLIVLVHYTPLLDEIGLGRILPPKRDPLKFLVGWKELGADVNKVYTGRELVLSNKYQIAAEMAFYVRGNPRTFVLHSGERRNQYDLWKHMLRDYVGRDAIFVSYETIPANILASFEGIKSHRLLRIYWRGQEIRRFHIYTLRKFSGRVKELIKGY